MNNQIRLIAAQPLEQWLLELIATSQDQAHHAMQAKDETQVAYLLGWKNALIDVLEGIKRSQPCD